MLFSGIPFLFCFLPVTIIGYYALKSKRKAQNGFLCLFSILFYAWGEPKYVIIMLVSIVLNWIAGLLLDRANEKKKKKYILIVAVVIDLLILFVFKYFAFAVSGINNLLFTSCSVPDIVLPIGISFFTFQEISYVIDVYRGREQAEKNILNVGLYISFFPQLIAGPIVRYGSIADQIENRQESLKGFEYGIRRFIIGLSKKVIIANNVAIIADKAFELIGGGEWLGVTTELSTAMAWLGAIAYAFQIYFDFSGYSDMAIGLGAMFGFTIPENFNYPYVSASVTEFWHRWHISLGMWFRDYLYFPLGGSRCDNPRRTLNLFIVWLCTGIWHGANLTFILWGLWFFVLLSIERLSGINKSQKKRTSFPRWAITMLCVLLGWVLFRAESVSQAGEYLICMFSLKLPIDDVFRYYFREYWVFLTFAVLTAVPLLPRIRKKLCIGAKENGAVYRASVYVAIGLLFIVAVSYIVKGSYSPFIYFNF